ncbi:MAG: LruC domain-containing protein [Bacteroidota bacterium]
MKLSGISFLTIIITILSIHSADAQTAPSFGTAKSFGILAAKGVSSIGRTVVNGNIGITPGTEIKGFPPGIINKGEAVTGDKSSATEAMAVAHEMYEFLSKEEPSKDGDLKEAVLGKTAESNTLTPGVYNLKSGKLTSSLRLDDDKDPGAVFIFKVDGPFTADSYSKVIMNSGGPGENVFWLVNGDAKIADNSTFAGHVIAKGNIEMGLGATTTGKLFSLSGEITLNTNNIAAVASEEGDMDGDGISDLMDDFPEDYNKAFKNLSSTGEGSTLAFEDQWPISGDFDLNDLVISHNYTVVTNAKNIVVQVIGEFKLMAAGGDIANGFGVEFPIEAGQVSNLKGAKLEDGQSKAVIVLFTDMHKELPEFNTIPGKPKSEAKSYTVTFDVEKGPEYGNFGIDFNPFIFYSQNQVRHEVHLSGKQPTSLADQKLFGTADDATNVSAGTYYLTKKGLPYAIEVPFAKFEYPIEGKDVTSAYLHFAEWARSGGKEYVDWYENLSKGYRNAAMIYTK